MTTWKPDSDVATELASISAGTVGTDIFAGPEAPALSSVPAACIFVQEIQGPAPDDIFGTQSLGHAYVQVIVRGAPGDQAGPKNNLRDIIASTTNGGMHRRAVTGYVSCRSTQSTPTPLGKDDQERYRFSAVLHLIKER